MQSRVGIPQPVAANDIFSRLPVENSSSQTDLIGAEIFPHNGEIRISKVPASAVIVKATLGLLAKPASFDVVHQEWRRTYRNVTWVRVLCTELGLAAAELSSQRYFESPRSLCRTSLQETQSHFMSCNEFRDQFHIISTMSKNLRDTFPHCSH